MPAIATFCFVLAGAIGLATIFVFFIMPKIKRANYLRTNAAAFGKAPRSYNGLIVGVNFWNSHIGSQTVNRDGAIDDVTWHDIDMDDVYHRLNACQTCVGDAHLYCTLRNLNAVDNDVDERERLIGLYDGNEDLRIDTQIVLNGLGRNGGYSLDLPYFRADTLILKKRWLYRLLAILPLVFAGVAVLNMTVGFWGILASILVNIGVVMGFKAFHEHEFIAIRYISAMIGCAKALAKRTAPCDAPLSDRLEKATRPFRSIAPSIGVLQFNEMFTEGLSMVCPLTLFMLPLLSYGKIAARMAALRDAVRELYHVVGNVDMTIALLSYRKSIGCFALPAFTTESRIAFDGLCHPLLEEAVPNSAAFDNDVLVTGSNASGKSTFLKSIAINCIFAQTINTCTAKTFVLRKGKVASSMAVADSVVDGDSYFVAEIKSMRRLLEMSKSGFSYFFIDEILKGTNTIERVSAASEVIAYLHEKPCLCFAATHDIELTSILAGKCENIHFRETVDAQGVHFDYRMRMGPSTSRNAILLLSSMGFPDEIPRRATHRAQCFEETGRWTDG